MPLTAEQRTELIDGLISNCDCWDDEDRETLNGYKDEKLESFTENLSRTSTSKSESTHTDTMNIEEVSSDDLKSEMKRREKLAANAEDKTDPATVASLSEEDWIKNAPDSVKNTFKYAHQIETEQKDGLITKLTAHITDNAEKNIQADRLRARTLDDLRADLALLPPQKTVEEETATANKEEGSLLDRVVSSLSSRPNDEPLIAPAMTFGDEQEADSLPLVNAGPNVTQDDQEWLKNAPAGVKAMLNSALATQQREKDEVITRLIANVEDTNSRFRMRDRLDVKSLEELKEMLSLVGNAQTPPIKGTPNYKGASTPTGNKLSAEEKSDILPLPSMSFDAKTG